MTEEKKERIGYRRGDRRKKKREREKERVERKEGREGRNKASILKRDGKSGKYLKEPDY